MRYFLNTCQPRHFFTSLQNDAPKQQQQSEDSNSDGYACCIIRTQQNVQQYKIKQNSARYEIINLDRDVQRIIIGISIFLGALLETNQSNSDGYAFSPDDIS